MEINNFKDMYLAELQELVSVESQLADALLRMAGAATHPALKDLLIHHHGETETQKQRLVTILQKHGAESCRSMVPIRRPIPTRPCKRSSMRQRKCLPC